jgi:hypothetical protein
MVEVFMVFLVFVFWFSKGWEKMFFLRFRRRRTNRTKRNLAGKVGFGLGVVLVFVARWRLLIAWRMRHDLPIIRKGSRATFCKRYICLKGIRDEGAKG